MSLKKTLELGMINPLSSIIGRHTILSMVILSGLFTFFITSIQTIGEYRSQVDGITERHKEIREVHTDSIASLLWGFDFILLQKRLDSLTRLSKVDYIEVHFDEDVFTAGKRLDSNAMSSEFPIIYREAGLDDQVFGKAYIMSDITQVQNYIVKQFVMIMIANGVKTLLVCFFVLILFHYNVNRRLVQVTHYLRKFNPRHPGKPLKLVKKRWFFAKDKDELDWLSQGVNKVRDDITLLYNNVRHEKERLSDFSVVASDWLWDTDHQGNIVYCSESMQKNMKLDISPNSEQSTFTEFIESQSLSQSLESKRDFHQCEVSLEINNSTSYLLMQAIARYEGNQFIGYRGTAIDISALKLAQIELEQLNQNLEKKVTDRTKALENSMSELKATQEQLIESEKLASLGGLVAGVAHEVNTPLGIAVTSASIIQESINSLQLAFSDHTLTSKKFSEIIDKVINGGELLQSNLSRASQLVQDFRRTAVDQTTEDKSIFNVSDTLKSLFASLGSEISKLRVEVCILGDEDITMHSYTGGVTQVISNLVLNSLDHAFASQPKPEITLSFYEFEDAIVFDYKDNGCGVDEQNHKKIFEPFYTSNRGRGGSGLGLNLVFNMVKQKLKGEIVFDSQRGKGVHFRVTLPRVTPDDGKKAEGIEYHI
ncbi:ATP-binding protein [Vibrio pectenicida]|uniref:PAS domain-containing sensor histidine kinase n=1 Tax=Vibrio pectenicida TaxID=62763 RepID=UPI003B9D41BC